jgi:amino acid adenylation domain-containing protein
MTAAPATVWEVFVAQARNCPDATAIRSDRDLSYAELRSRVEDLAERIRCLVPPGSVLALDAAHPGLGAHAYLAAARSGCAVLPLNQDSPPLHRAAVLADARPAATLVQRSGERLDVIHAADRDGAARTDFDGVAYILFTSGSTGQPKGVVVPHQALVDRLGALATLPGLAAGESMLAMTALSFDISIAEMLLPLVVGGTVVAANDWARRDPSTFTEAVRRFAPDVLQATPSFWRLALAVGWPGAPASRIWCGGEAMTTNLAARLLPRCRELWNVYGPTEATIYASAALVESPEAISLGAPLSGTGICLVNSAGSIVSPGVEGEIVLYGDGLALGYLDRPELTADRFRVGPTPHGTQMRYRTGDRGRYRPDGSLEYLGRTDGQIKLRGHRIELGEIERTVEAHPHVSQAVAVVHAGDEPSRAYIAAYVVASPDTIEPDLRAWLADRLPLPMRPARILLTDALPRTSAGKVDRVALARGDTRASGTVGAAASSTGARI